MLDARDGTLLDRAEVGVDLSELSYDAPDRVWQRARRFVRTRDITIRRGRVRSQGERTWEAALEEVFGCGAYAMVALGNELAILHHCPAASGANMTFVDQESGVVIAQTRAGTIGAIGHSMYYAEVELAYARNLLWIRGHESGGKYVCVIEPREHRLAGCLIQRESPG